ncbi:MAG: Fumarate reductase flavoprotein subunit [Syntrophorhabdaceae bacterium PtaU1.Bin034]|nr:MAG: Fumarate reductase flavoprotein subunit [Syntrophorhabdaceae bacterium PtaU1.Bin034]
MVKGFYAAGECACVSVHGANRLGGNSLLDTIVFGKIAAFSIDDYLRNNGAAPDEKVVNRKKAEIEKKIARMTGEGSERPFKILDELRKTMNEYVGIFRTREELQKGLQKLLEIKERYKNIRLSSSALHMNYELIGGLELEHMVDVSHAITLGALLREESRGAHFRRDFSTRNDEEWLKHTLVARDEATGEPKISFKDVTITRYQPMERTY